ncbi:MAG: chemotaxis protein CheW [Oscillospiraceae bacterium]
MDEIKKYLMFITDEKKFAVAFENIEQIIVAGSLTPIPEFPYYFAGACTYEGKAVPVIDSRLRFGFEACKPTDRSCIIICFASHGEKSVDVGILTDRISVMKEIAADEIQPCEAISDEAYTRYLTGVFLDEGEPCYIVDVDLMVNDTDRDKVFEEKADESEE